MTFHGVYENGTRGLFGQHPVGARARRIVD